MPSEEPNYLAHAFKSQYNLIGLGTALGFAILSGTFLPIIVAAGVEMVVLPLVSGSGRFQRLVRARTSEEADEQDAARQRMESSEMLQYMPEAERARYRTLQALANEIRQNYKGMDSSSQMLLEQLVEKLDFLLSFYLRMRYSLTRYHNYFNSTDPERIQERIVMLEHEMKSGPERVQQIKARTRSVLEKRLDRYKKALENRDLIDAQTETVQEVLQLLRDQSYSMRDPRSITEQIDGLVSSAEETERGVKDMEEILALENDMMSTGSLEADIEQELQAGRPSVSSAPSVPARARVPPPAGSPPPPPRKKLTN
ncbi:MAG TPA: hypothetical protein VFK70_05445 [Vicinamibacteria bacterium]|nr:hypothetical protein [Vicinamibacteria bacterium]